MAKDRRKNFEDAKIEATKINDRIEKIKREKDQSTSQGKGISFSPTIIAGNLNKPHFLLWVILIFIFLMFTYFTNFLNLQNIFGAFLNSFGFTFSGLITIFVMSSFILYGWITFRKDLAKFYIATALFIWMLDLSGNFILPFIPGLGSIYQGFEFPAHPIKDTWDLFIFPVLASGVTFALLYVFMIFKIIKRQWISIFLSFGLIVLINNLINTVPTIWNVNFSIPYGKFGFFVIIAFFGLVAWWLDRKRAGTEIPEFFSVLYMVFVFSFFWLNTGWQGNLKAWFHVIFIIAFGFGYIKPHENSPPYMAYLMIPTLLLIDFFGYGLLYRSEVLALQFIPLFVIVYILLP